MTMPETKGTYGQPHFTMLPTFMLPSILLLVLPRSKESSVIHLAAFQAVSVKAPDLFGKMKVDIRDDQEFFPDILTKSRC